MPIGSTPSPARTAWPGSGAKRPVAWGLVLALHALLLAAWLAGSALAPVGVEAPERVSLLVPVAIVATPAAPAVPVPVAPARPVGADAARTAPVVERPRLPAPAIAALPHSGFASASTPAAEPATAAPAQVAAASAAASSAAANAAPTVVAAPAAPVRLTRAPQPLPGNALPAYPEAAREDGLEGRVQLWVEVLADGRVAEVRWAQTSGTRLLDQAARDAVRQWRFSPALHEGDPVAGRLLLTLQFRLQGPVSWLAQGAG